MKGQPEDLYSSPSTPHTPVSHPPVDNIRNAKGKETPTPKHPSSPRARALRYHIPHPDALRPPTNLFPTPKKWHIVTVGQEVGIFPSWLVILFPALLNISSQTEPSLG